MVCGGIKILCTILLLGSQLLVSGNTVIKEEKFNEVNLVDTLNEADNEEVPNQDNLDKDVQIEYEDDKTEVALDGVVNEKTPSQDNLEKDDTKEDEDEKTEDAPDDDVNEKTPNQDYLEKDVPNEDEDGDRDDDVMYDEHGNNQDDDEYYSYEQENYFLDITTSAKSREGKNLKETFLGNDDGNGLDDEDDYSYETEVDFTEICPDDYVGIRSECFQMSNKSYSWDKAQATCEENTGQLASLKHPMALREYIIKHYPKASFWVGGRFNRNPDGWQWISGNKFSKSFPWATHNRVPKKNKGECMVLRYFPKQGEPEYVDNKCTRKIRFICEKPKVKLDLDKIPQTIEHTEQLLDTINSSEDKIDVDKNHDIGAPIPHILDVPSSEETIDDLKNLLSG